MRSAGDRRECITRAQARSAGGSTSIRIICHSRKMNEKTECRLYTVDLKPQENESCRPHARGSSLSSFRSGPSRTTHRRRCFAGSPRTQCGCRPNLRQPDRARHPPAHAHHPVQARSRAGRSALDARIEDGEAAPIAFGQRYTAGGCFTRRRRTAQVALSKDNRHGKS